MSRKRKNLKRILASDHFRDLTKMIRQEIYIKDYDWTVYAYYAVQSYFVEEITDRLESIGCSGEYLSRARSNMQSGKLNHGLTFSSIGESVFVVGLTSSASEFLNSLTHELHHLVCHICGARGVDVMSEDAAYLCGDIAQAMFGHVSSLICEHCREHQQEK